MPPLTRKNRRQKEIGNAVQPERKTLIVSSQDGVFANRTNSQSQLDLLFISTPIPYPCCNQPTSKPARYTSHSSKIKKRMKMRPGDSSWRYLRFGCRCGLSDGLGLGLLWLSNLLGLLWCLSRSGLWLPTIRRGPEGEVVSEVLHDECAVTV